MDPNAKQPDELKEAANEQATDQTSAPTATEGEAN